MEEVVYRRYSRMLEEKVTLPDLVIIDGGKGQLGRSREKFKKLEILDKLVVVGIAKGWKKSFPDDSIPLLHQQKIGITQANSTLSKRSTQICHKFSQRSEIKNFLNSELITIAGIGEKQTNC